MVEMVRYSVVVSIDPCFIVSRYYKVAREEEYSAEAGLNSKLLL